jgi:hypothetical protein
VDYQRTRVDRYLLGVAAVQCAHGGNFYWGYSYDGEPGEPCATPVVTRVPFRGHVAHKSQNEK